MNVPENKKEEGGGIKTASKSDDKKYSPQLHKQICAKKLTVN